MCPAARFSASHHSDRHSRLTSTYNINSLEHGAINCGKRWMGFSGSFPDKIEFGYYTEAERHQEVVRHDQSGGYRLCFVYLQRKVYGYNTDCVYIYCSCINIFHHFRLPFQQFDKHIFLDILVVCNLPMDTTLETSGLQPPNLSMSNTRDIIHHDNANTIV